MEQPPLHSEEHPGCTEPWVPLSQRTQMQQIRLEPIRLGAYVEHSIEYKLSLGEADFYDEVRQRLRSEIRAAVLGLKLPPLTTTTSRTVTVEVPDGWRQAWKADHAEGRWAGWIARRWPVRTRPVTRTVTLTGSVERAAAFPECDLVPHDPQLGRPVLILRPRWDIGDDTP